MPVERYRDASEMPRLPRLAGAALLRAMVAVWQRARLRGAPKFPRGVTKFRSIAEGQAAREAQTIAHLRRLRTSG